MANFTKKAIKETFLKLLDERPLSEITIKSIVEECGINRNSFYYHFQDLPTLLQEIMKEECDAAISKYSPSCSVSDCFDSLVYFALEHKRAIMHIYNSVDREVFERSLMNVCQYFVRSYLNSVKGDGEHTDEVKNQIVRYYKCVCFGIMMDWLESGLNEEHVRSFSKIIQLTAADIERLAEKIK